MNENELPPNLKGLWDKAVKSLRMQNFDYVTQLLLPIVKEEPRFLDARRALRKAQMQVQGAGGKKKGGLLSSAGSMKAAVKIKPMITKDPVEAMKMIEEELFNDPSSKGLNELLYESAMKADLPEVAVLALETVRDANPKDTAILRKLAHHYEGVGEHQKSADVFTAITAIDPTDLDAVRGVTKASTRASLDKNKMEDGGMKRDDEERARLELLSRQHLTPEQIEEQLAEFLGKYNENNEDIITVKRLANLYEKKGDLESAISYQEWSYHLSKGDIAIQKKIDELKDKRREMEFAQMEQEIADNPDAPDVGEKRARLDELKQERLLQKVAYAKDQVERNPTDPQLRFLLADYLIFRRTTPQMPFQSFNGPRTIRTSAPKRCSCSGRCFAQKGMTDMAVNQLLEAEKELNSMDDTKKSVLYERALLHQKLEETDKYLEALKLIYEVDYGYRDVAQRVEASYA